MTNFSNNLLEAVYSELGFVNGDLLTTTERPDSFTLHHWLEKGDWLALANKVGKGLDGARIEKVFFVNNNPVIVFGECQSDGAIVQKIFLRAWCMARPSFLFLAVPGELRVYSLNQPPQKDKQGQIKPEPINVARNINEVAENLSVYRREQVETGWLFQDELFSKIDGRADQRLIQDLKIVRAELNKTGLSGDKLKYAHALIGRSIFIRYLEDRGILTEEYFRMIATQKTAWQTILDTSLEGYDIDSDMQKRLYLRVLEDKEFTYALFQQLTFDFNGDTFPLDDYEKDIVQINHLKLLQRFLRGDTGPQVKLFFWAYKFDIIPTELISSIYEEFYHKEKKTDNKGTHYTPSALVEFVLSQVLTPEQLAANPRILDPACGSGIFLVEAFRRIVRYNVQKQNGQKLTPEQLRKILREQIAGIEINEEALRVAAFSLCLAFLNYQEPPDILDQVRRGRRLPNLKFLKDRPTDDQHFNILLEADAFNVTSKVNDTEVQAVFESECADIVVGNPPWGAADKEAQDWCFQRERSIGDKEYSQAFIWRTLDLLRNKGCAGLLVSSGVLFKQHPKNNRFRSQWLGEAALTQVVNFAHVRDVFFNANAPFAYVQFCKGKPENEDHLVRYWSAKKTSAVNGQQAVILNRSDLRIVKQKDLQRDDKLWKIFWWGSHRDSAIINGLSLDQTLRKIVELGKWPKGHGFQGERKKHNKPSDWLLNYNELPIKRFTRYGPLDLHYLKAVPEKVSRFGERKLYEGWRILVKRGITEKKGVNGIIEARLEGIPFCFRHSIHGINVDKAEDWERKILLGIIWSSLSRYYLFHTSGSWGTWHHAIHLEEVLNLPIRYPDNPELRYKIVNIVDRLRSCDPTGVNGLFDPQNSELTEKLERELDEAIFDLYELSELERDLVRDFCEVGLEFFYNHAKSDAVKTVKNRPVAKQGLIKDLPTKREKQDGLEGYLYVFLQIWNRELEPDGEFYWRVIGLKNNSPMIAVIFSTQNKGDSPLETMGADEVEWHKVLKQLDKNLLIPYNSRNIYIDGIVRVVTDTDILIIKRNERRLWTRSMAQEDAEATIVQAMNLQDTLWRDDR